MPVNNVDLNFAKGQRPGISVEPSHVFDVFLNQKNSAYDIFLDATSYEHIASLKEEKQSPLKKCANFLKKHKKQILLGAGIVAGSALLIKNKSKISEFLNKQTTKAPADSIPPITPKSATQAESLADITEEVADDIGSTVEKEVESSAQALGEKLKKQEHAKQIAQEAAQRTQAQQQAQEQIKKLVSSMMK